MAGPTTLSIGSVTVTASGGATGALLQTIINQTATLPANDITMVGAGDTSIPAAGGGGGTGPFELVINPGYSGNPSIPSGYTYVINGSSETLTGGDGSAVVGGDLNYSGGAGTVLATGTSGTVSDSAPGADINVQSTGDYTVNASGGDDTVNVDSGSTANLNVTGTGNTINLGSGGSGSGAAGASSVAPNVVNIGPGADTVNAQAGDNSVIFSKAQLDMVAIGGAETVVSAGGGTITLAATGGSQTIFDNVGGAMINTGPSTFFESGTGQGAAATVVSGVGAVDTIYALSDLKYLATAATSTLFIGGTGAATIVAPGVSTLFGGGGGGTYTEGSDTTGSFFFWGRSGILGAATSTSDTVLGSDGAKGTVWGNTNESITVSQAAAGSASFGAGNQYVAYGENDSINASLSAGGDSFVVFNASIGGVSFTGDTTLTGSSAGEEGFGIFNAAVGGAGTPASAPHTVTIQNWQATDQLFLGSYSAGDLSGLQAAQAAAGGGTFSFTLSDNTTIKFVGPGTGGGLIFG